MKIYLSENNMTESLREVVNKNNITVEDFNAFAKEAYTYAVTCNGKHKRNSSKKFTEQASILLIRKYMTVDMDALIDVWSVIAMYSFENLANKLVNTAATQEDDKEEMKCIAMSTIVDAAKLYDFDNSYRREHELSVEALTASLAPKASKFITYAATAIHNNLKRFNRETHPIHVPDKLAQHVAVISEVLEEYDYDISTQEIEAVLKEHKLKASKQSIKALESVCRIEHELNEYVSDAEIKLVADPDGSPEDNYVENETDEAIRVAFPQITAEHYGYESAYIAQMKARGMSFYEMETPFRRFKMISQYLDDFTAENQEVIPLVNKIKSSISTYGEQIAVCRHTSHMESNLLSSAINYANALMEEIDRGERTVEECIGSSCAAGSINYMFSKMFPQKKGKLSTSNYAQSKAYRNALKNAGLEFLADAIAARI